MGDDGVSAPCFGPVLRPPPVPSILPEYGVCETGRGMQAP